MFIVFRRTRGKDGAHQLGLRSRRAQQIRDCKRTQTHRLGPRHSRTARGSHHEHSGENEKIRTRTYLQNIRNSH